MALSTVQTRGACFDPTGQYRYHLWRVWEPRTPAIAFVMLNPSTADAEVDDPTIRACQQFAQKWHYGRLDIVNLFAYRTPQPTILAAVADPIGTDNDVYLVQVSRQVKTLVCAWGNWGHLYDRDRQVIDLLQQSEPQKALYCLALNQTGRPRHPLYVKRTTPLQRFSIKA